HEKHLAADIAVSLHQKARSGRGEEYQYEAHARHEPDLYHPLFNCVDRDADKVVPALAFADGPCCCREVSRPLSPFSLATVASAALRDAVPAPRSVQSTA